MRPSNSPSTPLLFPREVGPAEEAALGARDAQLQRRGNEPELVQQHAAATLADALAPTVGESDDTRGMPAPARACDVIRRCWRTGRDSSPS